MTGTWARLAAARMFIVVNLVTSMLLLTGVVLTYAVVGTTNLAALAGSAGPRGEHFASGIFGTQWQLLITLGLVLLALSVKAGLAPVHTWLPRAYPSTSPAVMALFSGLHTKVAVYAIFRVFMVVFEGDPAWNWAILAFMVLGMMIGGFAGLAESQMRSVIGYQMVNGIPYMLIALAFLTGDARLTLSAALFYLLHHMVVAASLIMSTGAIEETYGTGRIRPLSGLLRRDPFPAAVFAAGALAIVGLPPFSGLWGKLVLVWGIAKEHSVMSWIAIAVIVVSGMGALFSMLRVWREVFWGRPMNSNETDPSLAVPRRYVYPSAIMMVLSVVMFFAAGPLFSLTGRAADNLTDTTRYVSAIMDAKTGELGEGHGKGIGRVLPEGPSGWDNVPDHQRIKGDNAGTGDSIQDAIVPTDRPENQEHGDRGPSGTHTSHDTRETEGQR